MGKDHYDAVFASAPLNKTAGVAVSKGYQYNPDIKITAPEWDAPPKMRQVLKNMPQLVGSRFGRFTVIGLLDGSAKGGGALWVCRCACGKYAGRKAKAITNPANAEVDRCTVCKHHAYLQRSTSAEQVARRKAMGIGFRPSRKAEIDEARSLTNTGER